ncbi:MAG TPA: hypothetical protein VNT79_19390 [Phycisphaerae bacterium]|nr:hypothetical protein [Phycisphaerae bacterium]
MHTEDYEGVHNRAIEELNAMLSVHSFSARQSTELRDCAIHQWTLDLGFVKHLVHLTHSIPLVASFSIAFVIECPLEANPDPRLIGLPVEAILSRPPEGFWPTLMARPEGWRIGNYIARRIRNAEQALVWFQQFCTPQGCIDFINREMLPRAGGIERTRKRLEPFLKYLNSLPQNE